MKFLFLFLYLLLFNIALTLSQNLKGFTFLEKDHSIYNINLKTGYLTNSNLKNEIKVLGKIKHWNTIKRELPKDFVINVFPKGDKKLISLLGTGQMYELDIATLSLLRLDLTYFRGYNFGASQFLRNDTIFSIGGEGFWQKHSIITFYNTKAGEWDLFQTNNINNHPTNLFFSGFHKKYDTFFSAYLLPDSALLNKDAYFMTFSFKKRLWEKKGKLSQKLLDIAKKGFKSIWTGEYLILFNNSSNYLLALLPFENKLYTIPFEHDRFLDIITREQYYQNGYIYSRDLLHDIKSKKVFIDSVELRTLLNKAKTYERIYEPEAPFYIINKYYLISLICLLLIGLLIIYRFKLIGDKKIKIPESEWLIIHEFLKNPDKKISSTQINTLLQINNKSYDNQRQIRNRVIGNINQELFSTLNSLYLILRTANKEDKRMMDYYINPDVSEKDLKKLFSNITK